MSTVIFIIVTFVRRWIFTGCRRENSGVIARRLRGIMCLIIKCWCAHWYQLHVNVSGVYDTVRRVHSKCLYCMSVWRIAKSWHGGKLLSYFVHWFSIVISDKFGEYVYYDCVQARVIKAFLWLAKKRVADWLLGDNKATINISSVFLGDRFQFPPRRGAAPQHAPLIC